MSWSISVPKTPKTNFPTLVDEAQHSGQGDGDNIGVDDDVANAKELLKRFAERSEAPFVSGAANGHALQPGQTPWYYNGLSVSVTSYDK
jgi:hypothetical protein